MRVHDRAAKAPLAAKEAVYALVAQLLGGFPGALTPPVQAPDGHAAAVRVSFGRANGPLLSCQPLPEDK